MCRIKRRGKEDGEGGAAKSGGGRAAAGAIDGARCSAHRNIIQGLHLLVHPIPPMFPL